jgi:hypothetical protein
MGWQWKRWCGQGHKIAIRGFQSAWGQVYFVSIFFFLHLILQVWGQPLTMDKTEISKEKGTVLFFKGKAKETSGSINP